jgi:hypothetical protein
MHELQSANMNAAAGAIMKMPAIDYPDGFSCARARCELVIPFKNVDVAAHAVTTADISAALAILCSSWQTKFGRKRPDVVDDSMTFGTMQRLHIGLSGKDFIAEDQTSNNAATELSSVSSSKAFTASVAAGATINVIVEVARAFMFERLGLDGYKKLPGPTQMKTLQWEMKRGSGFIAGTPVNGYWAQDGLVSSTYIFDTRETTNDEWHQVVRVYQNNQSGRDSSGPEEGGTLCLVMETTNPGGLTTLGLFQLALDGQNIHGPILAKRVVRDADWTTPPGAININTLATLLYQPTLTARLQDLPSCRAANIHQDSNDLSPINSEWVYWPADNDKSNNDVAANVVDKNPVKLANALAASNPGLPAYVASIGGYRIYKEGIPEFSTSPGILARPVGGSVSVSASIPSSLSLAAHSMVASSSDSAEKMSSAIQASTAIAKHIPGGLSAGKRVQAQQQKGANYVGNTLKLGS